MRLRKERTLPKPRIYSDEELASMLAEDQLAPGKASEWLQTAKGSIRAAAGESADDARMAHTDGLEWLRAIRASIQREIGATSQERAAYYQEREKSLGSRIYHPAAPLLRHVAPKIMRS